MVNELVLCVVSTASLYNTGKNSSRYKEEKRRMRWEQHEEVLVFAVSSHIMTFRRSTVTNIKSKLTLNFKLPSLSPHGSLLRCFLFLLFVYKLLPFSDWLAKKKRQISSCAIKTKKFRESCRMLWREKKHSHVFFWLVMNAKSFRALERSIIHND